MGNSRYRVGIVGATWIAVRKTPASPPPFGKDIGNAISLSHAATLDALPDLELVAVCDLVPELLDDFKTDMGQRTSERQHLHRLPRDACR